MNQPGNNEQDAISEKTNALTAEEFASQLQKIRRKIFWRNLVIILLVCLLALLYLPRGFEYIWPRSAINIPGSNAIVRRQTPAGIMQASVSKAGKKYRSLTVDIRTANLGLYYRDENKEPFRSFDQLDKRLAAKNQRLVFATNAGMFGKDFFPLGLHVEHGYVLQNMHLPKPGNSAGNIGNKGADSVVGNFDLPHNGVFEIREGKAAIVETQKLADAQDWTGAQLATQSGPMLLIDGAVNPVFDENSGNLKIRSGVGIIDDKTVVFAISDDPISFYDFALIFKEQFNCGNALFLDGAISRMYIYETDKDIIDESIFAGMLAITVPKN
jgi:uncharacterized protein YigE (DUF2233 family)